MDMQSLCRIGLEARGMSNKDRITLQARVNTMIVNGRSEGEIRNYARSFTGEFEKDVSKAEGVGASLVKSLARMGWMLAFVSMVAANAAQECAGDWFDCEHWFVDCEEVA